MAEPKIIYHISNGSKVLFIYALIATLVIIFLQLCTPKHFVPTADLTAPIKDTIKTLETKVVVLDSVRTKFVYKWRTTKDTINLRDTIEVLKLLSVCDTIILTDSVEIATLKNINFQYQKICRIDSVNIDSLTRSNKKFWKGFRVGFWTGAAITQAANSGVKVLTTLKK